LPTPDNNSERNRDVQKAVSKYSGMAIKMLVIILAAVYLGKYIDTYFEFKKPTITVLTSLVGVCLAVYAMIKDLLKK